MLWRARRTPRIVHNYGKDVHNRSARCTAGACALPFGFLILLLFVFLLLSRRALTPSLQCEWQAVLLLLILLLDSSVLALARRILMPRLTGLTLGMSKHHLFVHGQFLLVVFLQKLLTPGILQKGPDASDCSARPGMPPSQGRSWPSLAMTQWSPARQALPAHSGIRNDCKCRRGLDPISQHLQLLVAEAFDVLACQQQVTRS